MFKKIKNFVYTTFIGIFLIVNIFTLSPVQAATTIDSTEQSLGNLFSQCQVSKNSSTDGQAIVNCLQQIVNFVFVLAVFILIFRIIGHQLGVIVDASGSTEGPVEYTRKALKDGIIGLILIGAPVLILNMLNTSTTKFLFDFKANSSQNSDNNSKPENTDIP